MRRSIRTAVVAVAGILPFVAACGDDKSTGPMFGDLVFSPSFVNIGAMTRDTSFTLRNAGDVALGPVLIGLDVVRRTTRPDSLCAAAQADVTPSMVSSLAVGASTVIDVSIDLSNTTEEFCPFGQYDADFAAAVSDQILGSATIRFDYEDPNAVP